MASPATDRLLPLFAQVSSHLHVKLVLGMDGAHWFTDVWVVCGRSYLHGYPNKTIWVKINWWLQ